MSFGKEISSLVKWTCIMGLINAGLVLVVFGLLARDNGCSQHLINAFYQMGAVFLLIGGISLFFAVIGSLVVRITDGRRVRELKRKRAELLAELSRLESPRAQHE